MDAPWINQTKIYHCKKQKAFAINGTNSALFKYYRNLVNRESYAGLNIMNQTFIQQLKGEHPKK